MIKTRTRKTKNNPNLKCIRERYVSIYKLVSHAKLNVKPFPYHFLSPSHPNHQTKPQLSSATRSHHKTLFPVSRVPIRHHRAHCVHSVDDTMITLAAIVDLPVENASGSTV